jgi:hypothetical protein
MAAVDMSDNYAGRVLQRSAFRSLMGRRRTPGAAIGSVLSGLRNLPPQPIRTTGPRSTPRGASTSG